MRDVAMDRLKNMHGITGLAGLLLLVAAGPVTGAVITSGTGPGGFESTTSTSSLLYWLRADAGVTTDGSNNVAVWGDQTSQDNDFAQDNVARQPLWVANGINGQPGVRFASVTPLSYDTTKKLVLSKSTQPQTIVIVNTTAAESNNNAGIIGRSNPPSTSDFGIRRYSDSDWRHGSTADSNDFTTDAGTMYVNGAAATAAAEGTAHIMSAVRGSPVSMSPTGLGDYFVYPAPQPPRPWFGVIGEVIAYDRALNGAERTVLDNALSAKYAISLAPSANDRYAGDDSANGDYDRDVVGIGRVDASNQLASAGSAGFGVEARGTLADGTYVMAGHKAAANSRVSAGVPHGFDRWDRVWYVDKTGNADVRVAFDSANAGLTAASAAAQHTLLYRSTNSGEFSLVRTDSTASGTQVTFDLADGQLQDGYYTLGEISPITGGTGPGGLETVRTNSSLLYWLKADVGITTDSSDHVSAWTDQTSRDNTFRQTSAEKQPTLQTSGFGANNLPALRFDGDHADPDGSGGSELPGANADKLELSTSTSPRTVFIVNRSLQHRNLDGLWGVNLNDFGVRRAHDSTTAWQDPGNENTFNNGGLMFVNGIQGGGGAAAGEPVILSAVGNSALLATRGRATFATTSLGDYFNAAQINASRAWNGDIAEVIVYDRELNLAERSVVENALSAKYAIPLSAGDHYAGDDPVNGDYDLDVFGIGQADAANSLYNTGSAGLGLMAMVNTLDDGDWVLAGHRTPVNRLVDEAPGLSRWDRAWYLDATGNVDVTLTFDFSDAGLSTEGLDQPLVLLYSPTNAFQFTQLDLAPILNGDQVSFLVSGDLLADGYYTLGIVPEPSSLLLLGLGGLLLAASRARGGGRNGAFSKA
jgi:hypothetical protein